MSQPPTSSPSMNSCGIVGQLEIADSSARMRGSGSTSTAAKRAPEDCSAATVRAENPHAGASGVPFIKRITRCSAIASAIASPTSVGGSGCGAGCGASAPPAMGGSCVGGVCDITCSWALIGGGRLGLQGEGMDGSADLRAEDLVYQAVL